MLKRIENVHIARLKGKRSAKKLEEEIIIGQPTELYDALLNSELAVYSPTKYLNRIFVHAVGAPELNPFRGKNYVKGHIFLDYWYHKMRLVAGIADTDAKFEREPHEEFIHVRLINKKALRPIISEDNISLEKVLSNSKLTARKTTGKEQLNSLELTLLDSLYDDGWTYFPAHAVDWRLAVKHLEDLCLVGAKYILLRKNEHVGDYWLRRTPLGTEVRDYFNNLLIRH